MSVASVLALTGLLLLWRRLTPPRRAAPGAWPPPAIWPKLTVIVPARDEAATLPALLRSLQENGYPDLDIIVVDDESQDGTAAVAAAFAGVTVVRGAPTPIGWTGKQWACRQGAERAAGGLLLFTDADTVHLPGSLSRAVAELLGTGAEMLSALPFHAGRSWWEALTGPFHALLLALTAPYAAARPGRVFAIGQYLLFIRDAYDRCGGHAAVAAALVEDLPLANRALRLGLRYRVHTGTKLYHVRMYRTLGDFIRGWRRNLRAGLAYSSPLAGAEATLMIAMLAGEGRPSVVTVAAAACGLGLIAWRQRRFGAFSFWGVALWPFSLGLFTVITALAVSDGLMGRGPCWKGRVVVGRR